MKSVILFFLLQFGFSILQGQEILPKFMTPAELEIVKSGAYEPYSSFQLSPPPGPVRVPAEWEEMQAVIIVWESFSSILSDITDALNEELEVIIVCPNESSVKSSLTNNGVDFSEGVSFYELPSNSLWVRDYGPNSAYIEETGELVWIDWIYNRPRYQDDQVPQNLGAELGITVYETATVPEDLVNTGGNFMSDGLGNAFSSDLVLDENGPNNQFGQSNHSEEAVDGIMDQYMGINNYIKMEALPYDLIHHIDMHMKLVDEETILVGEYPSGTADGPQIEANIQYVLSNFSTAYGRPFNIVRIPMPPAANGNYPNLGGDYRTYANALLANRKILLPTYAEEYDTTAIRIWEELMPGYDVVSINCNSIIPLSGALHCITKEVAAENPVTINMKREFSWCSSEDIKLAATVNTKAELEKVEMFYRTNSSDDFESVVMTKNTSDEYEFSYTALEIGDSFDYYVRATTLEGKSITRPLPGEVGPRSIDIVDCNVTANLELELTSIEIFPNPAGSITCISPGFVTAQDVRIELVDIAGATKKLIHNGPLLAKSKKFFIDASEYNAGQYIVRFSSSAFIENRKLVIAHN